MKKALLIEWGLFISPIKAFGVAFHGTNSTDKGQWCLTRQGYKPDDMGGGGRWVVEIKHR